MDVIGVNQMLKVLPGVSGDRPTARSGHRAVANESHMWVIGGYNPDRRETPLFKEMWRLNLTTLKWDRLVCKGDMPNELASHSALLYGQFLIVFGGTDYPFGENSSNKVSVCDLLTKTWKVLNCSGNLPGEKYGQAMAICDGKLYVYGGTSGFFYDTDLHELDLNTRLWTKVLPKSNLLDLPTERYRHEIALCDGNMIILGGGTSTTVTSLEKLHSFNFMTEKWSCQSTKPDSSQNPGYPAPRRCHGCVQLQEEAFISGGYDGVNIMNDVWKINLRTMEWTKVTTMPEPVYFHSAAVTPDGCMLVFGGVSCMEQNLRTDSCYRIWLKLPSLQLLCWLKLLKEFPQLLHLPFNKLRHIGVSKKFINKLLCPEGA